MLKILLIVDHPLVAKAFQAVLSKLQGGVHVLVAADPTSALRGVESHADVDFIVLDMDLRTMTASKRSRRCGSATRRPASSCFRPYRTATR